MKILDVVSNLETKLNTAITNEIANKQANGQFTPLENDRATYRFKLFLDTADYQGYDYLKGTAVPNADGSFDDTSLSLFPTRKVVRYLNGIISIVDSNVEGGVSAEQTMPKNLAFTANVIFFVPLATVPDADTMELIGTIRTIIDNAMSLNYFGDFNGYNMSVAYSLGRTGERSIRKGVGDSITLTCTLQYAFVENGINSTQISIRYGNSTIYAPAKVMSRVASQKSEVDLSTNSNVANNTTQNTTFTLQFDKPLQKGDFDDICTDFLANGDSGIGYQIFITIPNSTGVITFPQILCFNSVQITTQNALNAGLSITMGTRWMQ